MTLANMFNFGPKPVVKRKKPKSKTATKITDGGKVSAGLTHEKNDCAIRSLSIVSGISYDVIHEEFRKAGRKDGRGTERQYWIPFANQHSKRVLIYLNSHEGPATVRQKAPTLRKFIEQNPKGTFAVLIRKHMTTLIDGVIHDSFQPRLGSIVCLAYEFEEVKK